MRAMHSDGLAPALKQLDLACKDAVRRELISRWGSSVDAARRLNVNGNCLINMQELVASLEEALVDESIVQQARVVLARDAGGLLDVRSIFPEVDFENESRLLSTRDFWGHWCRRSKGSLVERGPKWQASGTEDLFSQFAVLTQRSEQAARSHKQMSQRIRLLKTDGFSDADVRQVVATHLPRGTGPRLENSSVRTFSDAEVRACRINYKNKVNDSIQNIQRSIRGLQEQRRLISKVKDEFHDKCNKPHVHLGRMSIMAEE